MWYFVVFLCFLFCQGYFQYFSFDRKLLWEPCCKTLNIASVQTVILFKHFLLMSSCVMGLWLGIEMFL